MAVVNRCAVGIAPGQKLLDGAQALDLDINAAGARQPCLYLIPEYESDAEAEQILEEIYAAIFEAELDFWTSDSGSWPAERSYPLFRMWFEVRFYPLIQDLVDEELSASQADGEFDAELRQELEALKAQQQSQQTQ
jgi:hypothetical protein